MHAAAAMQVEDVALGVHQRSDRSEVLQERLLGYLAQWQFAGRNCLGTAWRRATLIMSEAVSGDRKRLRIWLYLHAIFHLEDLHTGEAPNQIRGHAFMVGRQVLDQHERHVRIGVGRHAGEKRLERSQPAGRCTYSHYGETRHNTCWRRW